MWRTRAGLVLLIVALLLLVSHGLLRLALLCLNALVVLHLGLVSLRRVVLTAGALLGRDVAPPVLGEAPRLTALVPCRNEASTLPATLLAWDAVEYPRDRLQLVLIDDNSDDGTWPLVRFFAETRPWVLAIRRTEPSLGKGAVLRLGATVAAPSDAVAVFDADARPFPDCLQKLAAWLHDPSVAAVAGRMLPEADERRATLYTAVEAAVHQRLTMTGAARLGATVTLLGSAYLVRRDLLSRFPFSPEHRLEDIDLSLRLLGAGYRVAWEPNARCRHEPAADRRAFRAQHAAWARGYHRLARQHAADLVRTAPSMWLAADRLLFVGGYLDRVSLLLAVALWLLDATMLPALWMPAWFIGLVIALPLAQMPLALRADGWPWRRVGRALLSLPMAAWDLLAEWTALFADLARRPVAWRRVPRAGDEGRP